MTEEIKNDNVEVTNNPEVEETKMLSQEEVNRLIAQAKSKAKDEAKKEMEITFDERVKQAVEEAEKQAGMTSKELQKYKEQQAEQEKEKLLKQIEDLKRENTKRELRDEAIKTLSDRKLPVNDRVLNFVVKDTAEDTLSAIDDMAEIIVSIKNEYASSEPPIASGGVGNEQDDRTMFDIFDGK